MGAAKSTILHCPHCVSPGRVILAQPNAIGYVRRYSCNADPRHRWTTIEVMGQKHGNYRSEVHPLGWQRIPESVPIKPINEDK